MMNIENDKIRIALKASLAAFFLGVIFTAGLYLYIAPRLPSIEILKDVQLQVPLRIYSQDSKLVAEYGEQRRAPLAFHEIPEKLIQAVLAAEDDRFFEHPGVDYQGLLRAAFELVRTGEKSQGGSTITMQVARNFFLSSQKTFFRKFSEILLALKIERELTKEDILVLYLNKIYLGNRAYGISAAAQIYYGKEVNELTIAQIAMVAGLPKAPSRYNPLANLKRALLRRNYVLGRMHTLGFIDDEVYQTALKEPDKSELHTLRVEVEAPYMAEMVRAEMVNLFGQDAYTQGYRVYTTIDSLKQTAANRALQTALTEYDERHGYRGAVKHADLALNVPIDDGGVTVVETLAQPDLGLFGFGSVEDLPVVGDGDIPSVEEGVLPMLAGDQEESVGSSAAELSAQRLLEQLLAEVQSNIVDNWEEVLDGVDLVADLKPMLVINVEDKSATVYEKGGEVRQIFWPGLEWARKYISDNKIGDELTKAGEVLSVGDVVYVRPGRKGDLVLAQVPQVSGALVSLAPVDGAIQALVGGYDFSHSKFNRVMQADRQPGSSFKPFIYSAALEKGYTAASVINDAPIVFEDPGLEATWRPENYSGQFYGPTRLRVALTKSRNLVSIRLLRSIGIGYAVDYASRFGFPVDHLPRDLSLALGSGAIKPIELARGFAVFANGGYLIKPYFVDRIEAANGDLILQANPVRVCPECEAVEAAAVQEETEAAEQLTQADLEAPKVMEEVEARDIGEIVREMGMVENQDKAAERPAINAAQQVISPQNVYLMTSMMQDVIREGTGRRALQLGRRDLAGKTGTTNDQHDAWFSGFNSSLVTIVWVGFDKPRPMGVAETGARAALPMWIYYMKEALRDIPERPLTQPPGLVTVRINPENGLLANVNTPNAIFETFRSDHVPKKDDGEVVPLDGAEEGIEANPGNSGGGTGGENIQEQLF